MLWGQVSDVRGTLYCVQGRVEESVGIIRTLIAVCMRRVAVVLQWHYSGFAVVLQWCCSGVAVVLQWYYSGFAVVLQWCCSAARGMLS